MIFCSEINRCKTLSSGSILEVFALHSASSSSCRIGSPLGEHIHLGGVAVCRFFCFQTNIVCVQVMLFLRRLVQWKNWGMESRNSLPKGVYNYA
jgi:hypothetical protein